MFGRSGKGAINHIECQGVSTHAHAHTHTHAYQSHTKTNHSCRQSTEMHMSPHARVLTVTVVVGRQTASLEKHRPDRHSARAVPATALCRLLLDKSAHG